MATLVCFHAHPDDEAIATGGTMAQAADAGHRVVLVLGTRGEQGEPVPGVLRDGEHLWERRVQETHAAAEILGVESVHFLGYEDSGMMGEPTNDNPACLWQADVEAAAARLATILTDVACDVLTVYDAHGGYGHPDHIQVHRVGHRAAALAGVTRVYESTMNRDHIRELMAAMGDQAGEVMEEDRRERVDSDEFGLPAAELTHAVDVTASIDRKRRAMMAHASQIAEESFFLAMPPEAFAVAFGTEWYRRKGQPRPADAPFGVDLFADLT